MKVKLRLRRSEGQEYWVLEKTTLPDGRVLFVADLLLRSKGTGGPTPEQQRNLRWFRKSFESIPFVTQDDLQSRFLFTADIPSLPDLAESRESLGIEVEERSARESYLEAKNLLFSLSRILQELLTPGVRYLGDHILYVRDCT